MKRVICYANLNCFNSPDNVTDEHMKKFFVEALNGLPNNPAAEIVEVIVDRCSPDMHYTRREGWQRLLKICKDDVIEWIVIPATSMLSNGISDIIQLFREMRMLYDCEVYFMYEQIGSSEKENEMLLNLFAMVEDEKNKLKKAERKLRGQFYDVTQINREISAVSVLIDNKIYEKVERIARDFGEDVQSTMNQFFDVLDNPENLMLFKKIMGWEDDE